VLRGWITGASHHSRDEISGDETGGKMTKVYERQSQHFRQDLPRDCVDQWLRRRREGQGEGSFQSRAAEGGEGHR
jgi:hypothetical protein